MDSERYGRIRELFLAVEELPHDQQAEFLAAQAGDDPELIEEVLSLLREHDTDFAQLEGDSAKKPAIPSTAAPSSGDPSPAQPVPPSGAMAANAPFLPAGGGGDIAPASSGERLQKRREKKTSTGKSPRRTNPSEVTQHGSQRTHASPRYADEQTPRRRNASKGLLHARASKHRRFNRGWLWFAAMVPTMVIGAFTYRAVILHSENAAKQELTSVAESVAVELDRFLSDRARLVESWADQPSIQESVTALVESWRTESSIEALKSSPHASQLRSNLVSLSRRDAIKYVVWDRTGTIVASWLADGADLGGAVAPDGAGNLARAMRGETVLYGPEVLREDGNGFRPETRSPVMAEIVPVRNAEGKVVATLLVRGIEIDRKSVV